MKLICCSTPGRLRRLMNTDGDLVKIDSAQVKERAEEPGKDKGYGNRVTIRRRQRMTGTKTMAD